MMDRAGAAEMVVNTAAGDKVVEGKVAVGKVAAAISLGIIASALRLN